MLILELLDHLPNMLLLQLIRRLKLIFKAGVELGFQKKLLLTLLVGDFLGVDNCSAGLENLGLHCGLDTLHNCERVF